MVISTRRGDARLYLLAGFVFKVWKYRQERKVLADLKRIGDLKKGSWELEPTTRGPDKSSSLIRTSPRRASQPTPLVGDRQSSPIRQTTSATRSRSAREARGTPPPRLPAD